MTRKRLLAIIIALSSLVIVLSGCEADSQNHESDHEVFDESNIFETIVVESVGKYKQTIIYDMETSVEYAYLWHKSSGDTVSTMLYNSDGTPKLYSGNQSQLILISTQAIPKYKLSLMYDSETLVTYCCSYNTNNGYITITALYNSDGTLKLYQASN